ncbi:hypothetical protein TNIN_492071 [Trichonephila inaurata madagascariensis]|uniref:Uncharacterized protein n=1 Tax=Trichonephila inaurata madagascariensis TaxID=2747483 RepID=A0A8X6X2B5_9ARAC|nr:hypothetical protein TNIN_492071 [Trichonephila inaurata madagascariensis]
MERSRRSKIKYKISLVEYNGRNNIVIKEDVENGAECQEITSSQHEEWIGYTSLMNVSDSSIELLRVNILAIALSHTF